MLTILRAARSRSASTSVWGRSRAIRKKGGLEVNAAMKSINREVRLGENVMVDTRSMSAAHVQELQTAVAADSSLANNVLFWP